MLKLLRARPARSPAPEPSPEGDVSDAELVARAQVNPRDFALLYRRYLDPVHRYCYRRLGSREATEDATSLIFTKALAALPRYHDASFRAWLFTIAHHVVTDRYRDARGEQPLETVAELYDRSPSPEELVLAADQEHSVRELLHRLPDHQRHVVELRLAGLTGPEIARALGRSPANVNVTQWRAVTRLRELLNVGNVSREAAHDH